MSKKIFAGVLAIMFAVSLVPAQKTSAATIEELQALIMQLQAQLAALSGGSGTGTGYQFTKNLTLGSTGADVKALQQFLNANGFQVSASGAGSPGNESMYFGPATRAALAKFQAANGISPAVGYFGPLTRAKVNSMGGGSGGVIPTSSYLKVELVGPSSGGSVPTGSIYNPILKVKLSAGASAVTVTGIKAVRGGFIANTNVTGVSVWDESGNRYGNILSSLTSDGEASFSFGNSPITIAAGQSKTITIAANLASGSYSGTINFSLVNASSVTATGGAVMGTFPVTGPILNVVDGSTSLGDVRMDDRATVGVSSTTAVTSGYEGNVEVGYMEREIYKFYLHQNNSKEAVKLERVRLYVGGTIQDDKDLKNFKLVSPEGNVIATADRAYDRYVTFNLTTPYMIDKGLSKDFVVKADITDGSGRYFYVTLQDDYDVVVRGVTTGAGVLAVDSAGASLTSSDVQNDSNGWFKIKQGVATVSKASSSPSGNVAPGSQNVVLARFDVKAGGEALEIRKAGMQVNYAGVALTGTIILRNANTGETYLSIAADTTGIVTTTAVTANTLLTYQQNLSSYINLAAGETKTLEIVGTVSQSATSTSNYTAYMGQFYTKRLSTNDYTTLAASAVQANTLTVKDVTVNVTKNASFPDTTRSQGATAVKVGSVNMQAVGDDVRINTISLAITTSSNYQNVKLMDGSTQLGNTIGTPSASGNSFTLNNYVIARDTTKTIDVYADVLSTATTTSVVTVSASGVSGVGVASGKSLESVPALAVDLQSISISTPSVTISSAGDMPTSKIVIAGQTGVEFHKIKFEAQNEALSLKKITLAISSASTTVWTTSTLASNYGTVYLYDGSTLLGSGTFNSTNGTVQISGLNLALPQDQEKVLTVKVDVSIPTAITPTSVAALKLYSTSTDDLEIYSSQGLLSTASISVTSNALSNYMLFHAAAPSVANAMSNGLKTPSTNQEVSKFTITNTAPAGGRTLTLDQLAIVATMSGYSSTSTVTTFKLYDENGTEIASSTTNLTATTSSATLTFASSSSNWVVQSIAAGSSKTFTLKADTTNIRSGVTSGSSVYLSTKVDGSKGYLSTDTSGVDERFWNDGGVTYQYQTQSGGTIYGNNVGSDSYPVDGATITY